MVGGKAHRQSGFVHRDDVTTVPISALEGHPTPLALR
jgi:hypothetical protein